MELRPAIFFDRDGTVNVQARYSPGDPEYGILGYVCSWEDFEFVPDAEEAFSLLRGTEYEIIWISNQSGIERGKATRADVDDIFYRMGSHIFKWSGKRDYAYYCPHVGETGCACRKPKPFLIGKAAIELNIDLRRSWMIGDSPNDMKSGWNAGIRQLIRICEGQFEQPNRFRFNTAGGYPVRTLLEAVELTIVSGKEPK